MFFLSACVPAAVSPANLAPTFTAWVPEATKTPILDWATPAPSDAPFEQVATLVTEQAAPTPLRTFLPTPGE